MNFEDLTSEQKERLIACKTSEEILAMAQEEGYELSDDELKAVSGGSWISTPCSVWDPNECPDDMDDV